MLPRCTPDMAFYFNKVLCHLPLKNFVVRFKETKVVYFLHLKYSKDLQIKGTLVEHRIGFELGTKDAISKAEM